MLLTTCKQVFGAFSALALLASVANATEVTYTFDDGTFLPRFYLDGESAGDFKYRSMFDLSDLSLTLDLDSGVADLSGTFSGDIRDSDGVVIGTSTAELDIRFSGISANPGIGDPNNPILALGMEGTATSAGVFSFTNEFNDGATDTDTIGVFGGFANVGPNHAKFGALAGTPFNFVLFENGGFDVWIKSNSTFGDSFRLHGDIHGTANVPEPATLSLLGAGLLGLARRKNKSVDA